MTAPHSLAPGSRFGPYEIIGEIGLGRNAVYYLAAGGVALEVFGDHREDASIAMRVDEARLATLLDHPNLVRLLAAGQIDGEWFLAHEYIDGESVWQIRSRRGGAAWSAAEAVALALGVTAGLGYLHDSTARDGTPMHWVHRKLDPSTVFVTRDGKVKINDFALAPRDAGIDPRISRYLSPEQVRGLPIDRRSDLFALGTMLYELTTGRRPFDGEDDFAMLLAVREGVLVQPSARVAGYSSELERIVVRALERDLEIRYQTAGELARDLRAIVQAESLDVSARVLASLLA